MCFIRALVERKQAETYFYRRRFTCLRRTSRILVSNFLPASPHVGEARARRGNDRLELTWLPHYCVSISRGGDPRTQDIVVLINGHDGQARLIDLSGIEWQDPRDRERFEPSLDSAEAVKIAGRTLLQTALRRSAWSNTLAELTTQEARIVHYPFWVHYRRGWKQRIKVRILDAVTGKSVGPGVKVALVSALARANARHRLPQGTPHE